MSIQWYRCPQCGRVYMYQTAATTTIRFKAWPCFRCFQRMHTLDQLDVSISLKQVWEVRDDG